MRCRGRLRRFNPHGRFGFIVRNGDGREFFAHIDEFPRDARENDFQRGAPVEFTPKNAPGKKYPHASAITFMRREREPAITVIPGADEADWS